MICVLMIYFLHLSCFDYINLTKKIMKQKIFIGSLVFSFFLLSSFNSLGNNFEKDLNKEYLINVDYKIITHESLVVNYPNIKWIHIGRLEKINSGFNLTSINNTTDFSKINFSHDSSESFAYRLYDGNFLIIIVK